MLDKNEKKVMSYLSQICVQKRSYLISATEMINYICKKTLFSIAELDEIMLSLSKDNYIEFVALDGKKGYYYCVSLKSKGLTFLKDQKKEKKQKYLVLLKTFALAVFSFAIGFLLRIIFKG